MNNENKSRKKLNLATVIPIIAFVVIIALLIYFLPKLTSGSGENNNQQNTSSTVISSENVIYSDDNYTIAYLGFDNQKTEEKKVKLSLNIYNKTDEKVCVLITDGYTLDSDVFITSDSPVIIEPNSSNEGTYILKFEESGVFEYDVVEKLDLRFAFYDEEIMDKKYETDEMTIKLD